MLSKKIHDCRPSNWRSLVENKRPFFNFDYPWLFSIYQQANFHLLETEENFCLFEQYIKRKKILSRAIKIKAVKDNSGNWVELSLQNSDGRSKFSNLTHLCFYVFLTSLRKMNFREKMIICEQGKEKVKVKVKEHYKYNYVENLGNIDEPSLAHYFQNFVVYLVGSEQDCDDFDKKAKDWVCDKERIAREALIAFFDDDLDDSSNAKN